MNDDEDDDDTSETNVQEDGDDGDDDDDDGNDDNDDNANDNFDTILDGQLQKKQRTRRNNEMDKQKTPVSIRQQRERSPSSRGRGQRTVVFHPQRREGVLQALESGDGPSGGGGDVLTSRNE